MASRDLRVRVTPLLFVLACGGDDAPGGGTTDTGSTVSATTTLTTSTSASTTASTTDDTTSEGTSSESTAVADSSTGEPACPDTHTCIAVPEGWSGPSVLRLGTVAEPAPPCPESYPEPEELGGTDLVAAPAGCACSCGEATEVECQVAATLHYYGDDASCAGSALTMEIFTTACTDPPAVFGPGGHWTLDPVLVEGGACEAQTTMELEPAAFATTASACGGASVLELGCDPDEVCAPRSGDEALCVWQDGEAECPDGFERRTQTFHRGIEDGRGCDACTCGAPVGLCDDAFVYLFSGFCTPPITGVVVADGECHTSSGVNSTQSFAFSPGTPSAFCSASAPSPSGEASGTMPVTVCCDG